ncbi:MAG: hypothetical protein SPJ30_00740, partial [Faecalibacterium sp.]|nr:hypothetical protein [Faecalibacterium sp.]
MVQKRPQAFLSHFFNDDKTPAGNRGSCRTLMEAWTGIKGRSYSLCGKENRCLLAADGCETGFQIGKDVINVLGADGQA